MSRFQTARVPPFLDTLAAWLWRLLLFAVALAALVWVLAKLVVLVAAVAVALLLAALLEPVVTWLARHGWPRLAATWLLMLCGLGLLVLVGWWLIPPFTEQLTGIGDELASAVDQARAWLTTGPLGLDQQQVDDLRKSVMQFFATLGPGQQGAVPGLITGVRLLFEVIAGILLSVVLAFFFIKDGPRITAWLADQIDEEHRETVRRIGAAAWGTLSGYLRGVAVLATFNAVVSFVAFTIIGLPLVGGLALLEFVGSFVPLVGALVAGLVAAVVALVTGGVTDAALVVATAIVIEQVENHFFQPVVIGHAVRLHAIVVLVAVTAGGLLWGIMGAILAVPVTAAVAAAIGTLRAARITT